MTRRRFPSTKRQVGVHAGRELSWLFNGVVGVGGFARFSRKPTAHRGRRPRMLRGSARAALKAAPSSSQRTWSVAQPACGSLVQHSAPPKLHDGSGGRRLVIGVGSRASVSPQLSTDPASRCGLRSRLTRRPAIHLLIGVDASWPALALGRKESRIAALELFTTFAAVGSSTF
jgi:hypothetical protein